MLVFNDTEAAGNILGIIPQRVKLSSGNTGLTKQMLLFLK